MNYKAWIYRGPGDFSYEDQQMRPCGENDVILKTVYSTLCGSDIIAWRLGGEREYIYPGDEFGHECCTVIYEKGSKVPDFEVGQRVFAHPTWSVPKPKKGTELGGFSEYIYVENVKKGYNLFPIPDSIPDEVAALIEPLGVSWCAVENAEPKPGQSAVVWGCGGIGIGTAMCLRTLGCDKIAVVDMQPNKLKVAEELGFKPINTKSEGWLDELMDYVGYKYNIFGKCLAADLQFEMTGNPEILQTAYKLAGELSTLQISSVYPTPQTLELRLVTYLRVKIAGGAGMLQEHVQPVVDMITSGMFDFTKLYTSSFKPQELITAVRSAEDGKQIKIGLDFRS